MESPRKKKEVIKSFNVKVKFRQKVCRKKNVVNEQENQWVIEFLNGRDMSYTPGRRVYLGKFNKVKRITQKCYLLWTIRDKRIKNYGIVFYHGYYRFFYQAKQAICSSLTNNAFSIERSHNGLLSKKFVRIPFLWLLMITIVVHALKFMNQLKNGFNSAQYVRSGSMVIVSRMIMDNGIKYQPYLTCLSLTVFLSDYFLNFLELKFGQQNIGLKNN